MIAQLFLAASQNASKVCAWRWCFTCSWFCGTTVWEPSSSSSLAPDLSYACGHLVAWQGLDHLRSQYRVWRQVLATFWTLCHQCLASSLGSFTNPSMQELSSLCYIMFANISLAKAIQVASLRVREDGCAYREARFIGSCCRNDLTTDTGIPWHPATQTDG